MNRKLAQRIEKSQARFLRVLWCDNANLIRGKAMHASALDHFADGIGVTAAAQGMPVMADSPVPESGFGPVGEVRLVPDWSTFQPLPYSPGHVRLLGDLVLGGQPWAACPRDFLRRMIAAAAEQGLSIQAAFENEFFLLKRIPEAPGFAPVDRTLFASSQSMDQNHAVIDAIADALLAQGIPVELWYPESGPGQQELSIRYTDALEAADRQIVFRETVHAIAGRHGLLASFLPKIFAEHAGSGCHLHMSLWQGRKNATADAKGKDGLSERTRRWMGGILAHLPALMALTTPSVNSYRRIRPHFWSGAFCCWGMDNREAALRVPSGEPGPTNIELKTVDASANPYLALGAVLAAGLDGLDRQLDPGPGVDQDPGYLSEAERKERGIAPLPANLGEAIGHLERDAVLRAALGPELARSFLAIRRAEWEALKGKDLAEEVKLLLERW